MPQWNVHMSFICKEIDSIKGLCFEELLITGDQVLLRLSHEEVVVSYCTII